MRNEEMKSAQEVAEDIALKFETDFDISVRPKNHQLTYPSLVDRITEALQAKDQEKVELEAKCDHYIESAANFEMDLFSAKKKIKELEAEVKRFKECNIVPINPDEYMQDLQAQIQVMAEKLVLIKVGLVFVHASDDASIMNIQVMEQHCKDALSSPLLSNQKAMWEAMKKVASKARWAIEQFNQSDMDVSIYPEMKELEEALMAYGALEKEKEK